METFSCTYNTNNLFKKDTNNQMRIVHTDTRYNLEGVGFLRYLYVPTILYTILFAICITSIYTVFILRGGNLKCVWKHEHSTATYSFFYTTVSKYYFYFLFCNGKCVLLVFKMISFWSFKHCRVFVCWFLKALMLLLGYIHALLLV